MRFRTKERVAEGLDEGGFAVPVPARYAIDAGLKADGDAVAIRPFAVGLNVFEADGLDNHLNSAHLLRLGHLDQDIKSSGGGLALFLPFVSFITRFADLQFLQ